MIRAAIITLVAMLASPLWAVECRDVTYEGNRYTTCAVDLQSEDLRVFLNNDAGKPFGHFGSLNRDLDASGQQLSFAMNGGMYHSDRSPVGHYVEEGTQQMRLITNPGPGNFGLVPNGVFCIQAGRADVIETKTFERQNPDCRFATQSGPMLVIDGALHPRFLKDSTSRYIRNGVGTTADGKTAIFAISGNAVTFHDFGSFYKDALNMPNALFLDGNISRLYAPTVGRNDAGFAMGPIIGVVSNQQ